MTTKDYTHIPVSPILRNRMHTLIREYSAFMREISEHKIVIENFNEEINTIMLSMKKLTLDYSVNVNDKHIMLDAFAETLTKLAYKRDKLAEQIFHRKQKYTKELDVIASAIREEKPDLTDNDIFSYIDAFTSTLSKNILDK